MKNQPKVLEDFMTANPAIIGPGMDLRRALELMHGWKVRHLPVVKDSSIVGVLSERDIYRVQARNSSANFVVGDAMTSPAFLVRGSSTLATVAEVMAEERLGSAIVTDDNEEVIGIFTTTDALQILAKILKGTDETKFSVMHLDEYFDADNAATY